MKVKYVISVTLLVVLAVILTLILPTKKSCSVEDKWYENYSVIAHAGGGVDEFKYTNSLEAITKSLSEGTNIIEVDIMRTSDDDYVLVHGWKEHKKERLSLDDTKGYPMTLAEYKSYKIYGEYTPLSFDDLLDIMISNENMYVVWDVKYTREYADEKDYNDNSKLNDVELIKSFYDDLIDKVKQKDEKLLDRVIVQVYHPKMYEVVSELNDFENYIFTLYLYYKEVNVDEFYEFLRVNEIDTVAMEIGNEQLEYIRKGLLEKNKNNDFEINLFTHTYNDVGQYNDLTKNYGFTGIFSDFVPEQNGCLDE